MVRKACFISALILASGGASAAMWSEGSNGDLSNTGLAPSAMTLDAGSNLINGGFGSGDLDYLAVTILPGFVLDGIITGTGNNQGLSRSFIGVQSGSVMTVPPTTSSASGLLGWTHFGGADGVNLLPRMSAPAFGSSGFTAPLAAGTYTFWINETLNASDLTFDLDFHVSPSPVPLPGAAWMLGSGLLGLAGAARRRQRVARSGRADQ